jgi:hypothetical protein
LVPGRPGPRSVRRTFVSGAAIFTGNIRRTRFVSISKYFISANPCEIPSTFISGDNKENAVPLSGGRKYEIERQKSLDVEKWLKNKFREGCRAMKEKFEHFDTEKRGIVSTGTCFATFDVQRRFHSKCNLLFT